MRVRHARSVNPGSFFFSFVKELMVTEEIRNNTDFCVIRRFILKENFQGEDGRFCGLGHGVGMIVQTN